MAGLLLELIILLDSIKVWIFSIILEYGDFGILAGMFFGASVAPIPTELIVVTAGLAGLPIWNIVIFGTIGAVLGSIIGYYIGYCGREVVNRYGKYMLLTNDTLLKAEKWVGKHDKWAIILARFIPFLPYKVFSIVFGLMRVRFRDYIILTTIGTIPMMILLSLIGNALISVKTEALIIIGIGVIGLIIVWKFELHQKLKGKLSKKDIEHLRDPEMIK